MSFPRFRFTLGNTVAGNLVISEPGGWDEAVLKLERNEEFFSLVEFYDQPLTFYGQDIAENGGLTYIRAVEQTQGPDAQITILIEISLDLGVSYSTIYDGLLDITSVKEMDFYKLECGIIRNDFWQKFINRKATPVDLAGTTDLDGGTRTAVNPYTLNLPSQKIRRRFAGTTTPLIITSTGTEDRLQVGFDLVTLDEIQTNLGLATLNFTDNGNPPNHLYEVKEAGDYTFDIRIELSHFIGAVYLQPGLTVNFVINDNQSFAFTATNYFSGGINSTAYTYAATHTLQVGDSISFSMSFIPQAAGEGFLLYGHIGSTTPAAPSGATEATYMNITADTVYTDTTVEAYLIKDAATNVLQKIIGENGPLISAFMDGTACGHFYALTRGLNVRGYTLSQKPFFMSFDDWWAGANPILNLGLGYTSISGTDYLEIEQMDAFFDASVSLNFDYVNKIERSYNSQYIIKKIDIGYEIWAAESGSGIDDPQTRHTYRTRFKTIGNDNKTLSKFYAASLGIEQTRRNRLELGDDWKLDEEVMIIALNKSDVTHPELDENFTSVTGLLNSATRYNIRLSVARIFKRWVDFFSGCLGWYPADVFSFASGEGNFDMASTLNVSDCEGDGIALSEKQNIAVDTTPLFVPIVYTFEHPLTYAEYAFIKANRKKAIGVSRTNSGHTACFIMSLEYEITHGKGKFTVMQHGTTPIQ